MNDLKVEYVNIKDLTPFENNSKIHTCSQIKHIANSIETFGFNDPIGIAGSNNVVLEGNGRVEAARMLGITELPCVRLDHMSEQEKRAYVIVHNATNLETGFDETLLLSQLDKLQKKYNFENYGINLDQKSNPKIIDDDNYYKHLLQDHKEKLTRNEFELVGEYEMPLIKKQDIDINKINLINFSNTKYNDIHNNDKTVQFFTFDYRFNYVYSHPKMAFEKLKQYYCLLSPDYSIYTDMPLALQIKNTFKNRWCGAFFQSMGMRVIPTIEWGDERSYVFCFDGIEKHSVVAVSTYGKQKNEEEFMKGYDEMLKRIEPCAIICYEKPFPKMKGKIKAFYYNHNEQRGLHHGFN